MNLKRSTKFLLWFGNKVRSGDKPTEEEVEMFNEARKASMSAARIMGIKPEDYEYTSGKSFEE